VTVASDENVEIQYYYDGLNNTVTLTAINPTTGNQVTEYLYEDKYNASLQTSAIYPDSSDTDSKGTDQVKTSYYIDGKIKTVTDQNGTVRTFEYDAHRLPIADVVTTLGNGVDGNVKPKKHILFPPISRPVFAAQCLIGTSPISCFGC
jgi:YD repeat-containing protein